MNGRTGRRGEKGSMRKKTFFLAVLTAACLLGWTERLTAGNLPGPGAAAPGGGTEDQENSDDSGEASADGQNGPDGKGNMGHRPDQGGDNNEGEGDAQEAGENGGGGENGERGEGADGGNRPIARKVSYKDSITRAAKYTAKKQYVGANREYNRALTMLSDEDRRKVFIYERQGWLALKLNDIPGAEGFYLAAIYQAEKIETFDKSAVNAYRGAAYCYEKDGEISSAVENYQLALKHATDKAVKADIRKKLQRLQAGQRKKKR